MFRDYVGDTIEFTVHDGRLQNRGTGDWARSRSNEA